MFEGGNGKLEGGGGGIDPGGGGGMPPGGGGKCVGGKLDGGGRCDGSDIDSLLLGDLGDWRPGLIIESGGGGGRKLSLAELISLPSKNPPTGALDRDRFLKSSFFLFAMDPDEAMRSAPKSSAASSSGLLPVCLKLTFANSGISSDIGRFLISEDEADEVRNFTAVGSNIAIGRPPSIIRTRGFSGVVSPFSPISPAAPSAPFSPVAGELASGVSAAPGVRCPRLGGLRLLRATRARPTVGLDNVGPATAVSESKRCAVFFLS